MLYTKFLEQHNFAQIQNEGWADYFLEQQIFAHY